MRGRIPAWPFLLRSPEVEKPRFSLARMSVLTPEEISDFIRTTLLAPRSVSVAEERVENHNVGDLIKALQFAVNQSASSGTGLIFKQLVPPGAGGTP